MLKIRLKKSKINNKSKLIFNARLHLHLNTDNIKLSFNVYDKYFGVTEWCF
jgi:hypothetical protein